MKIKTLAIAAVCLLCQSFTLVLDPGHGGHDSGAVGEFSKEKVLNLDVALKVGKMLQKSHPEVKIIYTRTTDVFIPLQERANIANRNKANLFVSIHTNAGASGNHSAFGVETFTLGMHRTADNLAVARRENSVIELDKNDKQVFKGFDPKRAESYIMFEYMQSQYMTQSVRLARSIQKEYEARGRFSRHNHGVQQAGFLVLRQVSMPSVLTEIGFISNYEEEKYLNTEEGQNAIAQSIYNGIMSYINSTQDKK